MKYLIDFSEFTLENNNKKYQGDFIKSLNGWDITYSDYPGHYITDKLQDRSKSKISNHVIEINGLVGKMIRYLSDNNIDGFRRYGVKFKNKKYIVVFETRSNKKLWLMTIRRLEMGVRLDTEKIFI